MLRLIDANNPSLGGLRRQNGGTHTGAAKGVEHDGPWVLLIDSQKLFESLPRVCRAGLLPGVLLMVPYGIPQVGMGSDLIGLQHGFMRSN